MLISMQISGVPFDQATVMQWGEKAIVAIGILLLTWLVAFACKWAFAKLVDQVGILQGSTSSGESIGQSLGKIVSLLVWLFGIIAVLQYLKLTEVITPIQTLLNDIMGVIPNLLGAGIFFFVGLVIARIFRQLLETILSTVNLDKWAARGGVTEVTGSSTLSKTISQVVFALIMIFVSIGALGFLKIESIAGPATAMLENVALAIPLVIGAALLLALFFFAGRWVSDLFKDILANLGADRAIESLGILPKGITVSGVVSKIILLAIMLTGAIAATRMLQFPELTNIINEILALGGRVIFGGIIIAIGFWIATLLANIVSSSSDGPGLGANIVRYSTIILFVAMGLRYMGIGDTIIDTAFSALVIGGAAAAALIFGVGGAIAFGLGGRDAAARFLKEKQDKRAAVQKPAAKKPAAKAKPAAK